MKSLVLVIFFCTASLVAGGTAEALRHPYMLVSDERVAELRLLLDSSSGLQEGYSVEIWQSLLSKVDRELKEPVVVAGKRNRTYYLVGETCSRITDMALAALITNDRKYVAGALEQIEVLFDQEKWPHWSDEGHLPFWNSDLRHGQFVRAIALAYDWLYPQLSVEERQRIVSGLDRCAIKPFKRSVAAKEKWIWNQTNWKTCIVGGYGMLGMALGGDHPDALWLREFAEPLMDQYMEVFGVEGEFNESPGYASSTRYLVDYYMAQFYSTEGQKEQKQLQRLGSFCHWYLYCISPPNRVIAFGDALTGQPANVSHFSAIASVLRDPVIQWSFLKYKNTSIRGGRRLAFDLLFFDPTLKSKSPAVDKRFPLGRFFPAQAGIVSSRSSWDPEIPLSIVHAKASAEETHRNADWGQVCIDGDGQRLIVDLGSPPGYPREDKKFFYNYQQSGHNVLAFGEDEMDVDWKVRRKGRTVWSEFDDERGGAWVFDLSEVYGEDRKVIRNVIHLLPRIVVVLDEATLPTKDRIRLRWHTSVPVTPDADGQFSFGQKGVTLSSSITSLAGGVGMVAGKHRYSPPYDKNRLGDLYRQRNEPFIEIETESDHFRMLSLFCVFTKGEESCSWKRDGEDWCIQTPEGEVRVGIQKGRLQAQLVDLTHAWQIDLKRDGTRLSE